MAASRKDSGSTSRTTVRKKAIPKALWSALGPLPVNITLEGIEDEQLGKFDYQDRVITVRPDLHDAQKRHTVAHEWTHSVFWDSGLHNALSRELEEQLCDALATALVASRLI